MKKKLLILPIALLGLTLSSCGVNGLKDNFTEADQEIDTPWTDYVMPASGIEFMSGEESITLQKGEAHTYQYTILPRGATANSLNWFSFDENIATVNQGVVTAVGGGETTITASSPENAFDPVELNVNVVVPLKDFSLTIPNKLDWDGQYRFDVTYDPADTTERALKYEISESSVDNLLSINDEGVVTTYNQNGTAKFKVSGGKDIVKEYTLTVNSIAVNSVSITDAAHELEVNHDLQLNAVVSPNDARDLMTNGVKYYSKNPEIASVNETSGLVKGLAAGNALIYAECGGVKSSDYAIEVYKVKATAVDITTADFILSNADSGELSKQLAYTLTLDRAGHDQPSAANILFASSNERVATVDENGLVTATGPGNAEISIQVIQDDVATLEDSVNVNVNIVSTALTISGGNSFYNDGTLTLTANLTPNNVSNNEITWSVTPDNIVSLSATTGASVTLTPVNNDATGEVKVTAKNTNGASNELVVTVNERPSLFTAGRHYIVGNSLYNTGESVRVDNKSSWTTAKYAYEFSYAIADPAVYEQYKGTIKFQVGDQFRYFIGADYWVPAYEVFGENRGYHIEISGENNVFSKGQMRFVEENDLHEYVVSDSPDANIEVLEAGYYDLYAKLYKNDDGSKWYSLYIEKVPTLSVEINEITMGLEESYQIKAHNWIGNLVYSIKSGEDLISLTDTGLVTGKGVAGVAIVTVNDDRNVPVDVTINLEAGAHAGKTIYLNANGIFDTDNVVSFIHSWGAEGASAAADTMMNKVEGQNIIYTATIPLDHTKLDFVRCPEGATSIDWETIYNQSKDQDIPTDGKDLFTVTGWSEEQDNSHRTYVEGNWSIFDNSKVYEIEGGSGQQGQEDPHGDSYIMYGNDPTWNYVALENNPENKGEMMASLTLEANTEFVIKMANDDWRHFENNKDASSNKVVEGTELDDGSHNFKASADGVYSFYILKDKEAEGGKTVYIGYAASGGGEIIPVTPNNVTLYLTANWANWESPKAYVFNKASDTPKVAWPGENMTYVGVNDDNDTIYSYTVDINEYDTIIFSNGSKQTVDIDISAAKDADAYFLKEENGTGNVVVEKWGTFTSVALTSKQIIYFTNNKGWNDAKFYVFNSTSHASASEWPGNAAKWVFNNEHSQGVYRLLIDTTAYDAFIFNGSEGQTIDILLSSLTEGNNAFYLLDTQDGSGHYEVGQWSYNPLP